VAKLAALVGDEGGVVAGHALPGNPKPYPAGRVRGAVDCVLVVPLLPEEAALTERGGEKPLLAIGHGGHGRDRAIEIVGDLGGLVEDEEIHGLIAADGGFLAG